MKNISIQHNIPLAPLSTFHIGGNTQEFVTIKTPEELVEAIEYAKQKELPFHVLAGGSNIVFPDEGLSGLVIQITGQTISWGGNHGVIDAGVSLTSLIDQAINRGLSGLEKLSGIPGTVGGAVVGNAGAYGRSISEVVLSVDAWDGEKKCVLTKEECQFSYRESIFKKRNLFVLTVNCRFKKGDKEALQKASSEIIHLRLQKYHPGIKCPGSFFKNVLVSSINKNALLKIDQTKIIDGKIPAGFLLDSVSARGMRVGDIEIANFHGNLFINLGRGTAKDVKELARILKEKVKQKFGIILVEEIRYF